MVAERSPIGRVRISSLDPEELSDRILEIMAASEKFCPHLHLPLQAGTDATLVRMRRRYDIAHFKDRVERILAVDALGGYRHRSYRWLSRRDHLKTSTITLSLSKRCRLPTFTSSRTP